MNRKYPALVVDHKKLRDNMKFYVDTCARAGIDVAGVIKVTGGMKSVALDYEAAGAKWIASSRVEHLRRAKEAGVKVPTLMIRIPMLSELDEILEVCDYSLQSELAVMKELNDLALAAGKVHKVVLMADTGDLREGWFDYDELVEVATIVENELKGLHLAGIGTNLGCTGSIMPTPDKMELLADLATRIEQSIGRELEIVSGGASSSMMPVFDGKMPAKINMLRIGEAAFFGARNVLRESYHIKEVEDRTDEPIVLEAEIVELKTKPSYPIGEFGVNAFGEKPVYIDKGDRLRALLVVGANDFADCGNIEPMIEGATIEGASSDHTILDIEESKTSYQVGDIITFRLNYNALMMLSGNENVKVYDI